MDIREVSIGDYDPTSRLLRLEGTDTNGAPVAAKISVPDRQAFLGWLSLVMYETEMSSKTQKQVGLVATSIALSTHQMNDGGLAVGFTFTLDGGAQVRLCLPVDARCSSRIQAVQAHFEEALKEMGYREPALSQ